jgi:hypothetical protein
MEKLFLSAKALHYTDADKYIPVLLVSVTDSTGAGVLNLKEKNFSVRRQECNVGTYRLPIIDINNFTEEVYHDVNGENTTDGIYTMRLYPAEAPAPDMMIVLETLLTIRVQTFGLGVKENELVGEPPIRGRIVVGQGWTTAVIHEHKGYY